jgi:hypothetical protein
VPGVKEEHDSVGGLLTITDQLYPSCFEAQKTGAVDVRVIETDASSLVETRSVLELRKC